MATKKNAATELKGLVKVKALLLDYANEKAKEGKRKVADNIRYAVEELDHPKIQECAKIMMEDGISAFEIFAINLLTAIAAANE
jgi:hypothetical protein